MKLVDVATPNLFNKTLFLKRIEDVLASETLFFGKYTAEFEATVCDYLKVKHALLVTNPTIGLELILECLTNKTKEEIIIPSFSPPYLAMTIAKLGFKPIFADITKDYVLDPKSVQKKITNKTAAVMPCNLLGNVCDISYFESLKDLGIEIIYESSNALGIFYDDFDKYIGNFGDCELFGLNAYDLVNSGMGAIITTNNSTLYEALKIKQVFGIQDHNLVTYGTEGIASEIHAALGLTNFENLQELIEHNYNNYTLYKELLPSETVFKDKNCFFSNFSHIVIEVNEDLKEKIITILQKKYIYPRSFFIPNHQTKLFKYHVTSLPRTENLANRIILLPTGKEVGKEEIKIICETITSILEEGNG